jgi:hypothetical protein
VPAASQQPDVTERCNSRKDEKLHSILAASVLGWFADDDILGVWGRYDLS